MQYVTPLSAAEIETLQPMHAHHPSRRPRMRAHSRLLSHQRYPMPQIARLYQGYGQDTCKKVSQGHEGYLGSDALDDRPHHRTADTTY